MGWENLTVENQEVPLALRVRGVIQQTVLAPLITDDGGNIASVRGQIESLPPPHGKEDEDEDAEEKVSRGTIAG